LNKWKLFDSSCVGAGGMQAISYESQRHRIYARKIGNPGDLEMAIPDRLSREIRKDGSKASIRRVQLKIDRELKLSGQVLTS
jgi:hypothetical protein